MPARRATRSTMALTDDALRSGPYGGSARKKTAVRKAVSKAKRTVRKVAKKAAKRVRRR